MSTPLGVALGQPREPEERSLLSLLSDESPFFFASEQETLLARPEELASRLLLGRDEAQERLARELAQLRNQGHAAPHVAGALPFHDDEQGVFLLMRNVSRQVGRSVHGVSAKGRSLFTGLSGYHVQLRPSAEHYVGAVVRALARIERGELSKVVLARSLELTFDQPVARRDLLRELVLKTRGGYAFLLELSGAQQALLGVTPELLLQKRAGQVFTHPLAGSCPRGRDQAEDQQRCAALLRSEKDRREHALVVEAVVEALRPFCSALHVPSAPALLSTPTMWHLGTPISGELRDPQGSSLALAQALHPTPAVCGVPRAAAERALRELEGFSRGLFAGAVGHMDANGDGVWAVTLRCAELSARSLRLCAGAGVVAGSEPWAELDETAAKLSTVLRALGLSTGEVTA